MFENFKEKYEKVFEEIWSKYRAIFEKIWRNKENNKKIC